MTKLAIGINIYNPQKRHIHCIEALIRLKQEFGTSIELYNLTFSDESNAYSDFVHLPLLQKSSHDFVSQSSKRLPIARECFDVLSEQNCDYFLYLNNDILASKKLIKLILKQDYETYSFSRHDILELQTINDDAVPIKIEIAGFDAWSCKSTWWRQHRNKFANYLVGQWQWDVDYALTMYNHSHGKICNDQFYIGHEDHPRAWNSNSPEAVYNDSLWKQTPYQHVWGEYIYSNLVNRQPRGRFLTPLQNEDHLTTNLLKLDDGSIKPCDSNYSIDLPEVTLLCIDCKQPETALKALQYSSKHINFAKVVLLGDTKPVNFPDNFEFITIPKINSTHEYSIFVIHQLTNYVNTDHCLVIQSDGFVVNPHLWKSGFLNYDYIGAPWSPQNPWVEGYDSRVGNGGFSLRSKRLLDATAKFTDVPTHEDLLFTQRRYFRRLIETQFDLKIAPAYLAYQFSQEQIFPGLNVPLGKSFGFHGPTHSSYFNLLTSL